MLLLSDNYTMGNKDTDFSVSKELTLPQEAWAQGISSQIEFFCGFRVREEAGVESETPNVSYLQHLSLQ